MHAIDRRHSDECGSFKGLRCDCTPKRFIFTSGEYTDTAGCPYCGKDHPIHDLGGDIFQLQPGLEEIPLDSPEGSYYFQLWPADQELWARTCTCCGERYILSAVYRWTEERFQFRVFMDQLRFAKDEGFQRAVIRDEPLLRARALVMGVAA